MPANVLASRELFPVGEAYWRIPTLLLCSGTGMATGGWIGGILYDHFGYYAPAFATGVAVSAINFMIISALAFRAQPDRADVIGSVRQLLGTGAARVGRAFHRLLDFRMRPRRAEILDGGGDGFAGERAALRRRRVPVLPAG